MIIPFFFSLSHTWLFLFFLSLTHTFFTNVSYTHVYVLQCILFSLHSLLFCSFTFSTLFCFSHFVRLLSLLLFSFSTFVDWWRRGRLGYAVVDSHTLTHSGSNPGAPSQIYFAPEKYFDICKLHINKNHKTHHTRLSYHFPGIIDRVHTSIQHPATVE